MTFVSFNVSMLSTVNLVWLYLFCICTEYYCKIDSSTSLNTAACADIAYLPKCLFHLIVLPTTVDVYSLFQWKLSTFLYTLKILTEVLFVRRIETTKNSIEKFVRFSETFKMISFQFLNVMQKGRIKASEIFITFEYCCLIWLKHKIHMQFTAIHPYLLSPSYPNYKEMRSMKSLYRNPLYLSCSVL